MLLAPVLLIASSSITVFLQTKITWLITVIELPEFGTWFVVQVLVLIHSTAYMLLPTDFYTTEKSSTLGHSNTDIRIASVYALNTVQDMVSIGTEFSFHHVANYNRIGKNVNTAQKYSQTPVKYQTHRL
jgi:hypothetical protein